MICAHVHFSPLDWIDVIDVQSCFLFFDYQAECDLTEKWHHHKRGSAPLGVDSCEWGSADGAAFPLRALQLPAGTNRLTHGGCWSFKHAGVTLCFLLSAACLAHSGAAVNIRACEISCTSRPPPPPILSAHIAVFLATHPPNHQLASLLFLCFFCFLPLCHLWCPVCFAPWACDK